MGIDFCLNQPFIESGSLVEKTQTRTLQSEFFEENDIVIELDVT